MNSIICQIAVTPQVPSKTIIVSRPLIEKWKLVNGQIIKLEMGNQSTIIRVIASKLSGKRIFFSPAVARQLSLPFPTKTRAVYGHEQLRLGPVIGILTTGFTGNPQKPFGKRSVLFRSFILAGETEKPLFYVFTPEMINWHTKTVTGWYYQDGRWISFPSPLPDVVYERVPNRKIESLYRVKVCIQRLKENENCQIFNQGFFNKWSIHLLLSKHPYTCDHIPETYLYPSLETIEQMLKHHQMVYLKPSGGSLGLGIFRIIHHPQKGYFCRFHQGEKNVLHRFETLDRLIQHYFSHQPRKFEKYLVQQGIRLIRYHQRPVDFRIHLHKDSLGQWRVVAIGTKMAGPGCVTTHVRTGGAILSTYELLKKVFGKEANEVQEMLKDKAITVAKALEQQIDGPLGELGLDMGIDINRKVWLFEANAKPGRHIFHHPSLREAGRQSAKYITDYSLKLANFV